MDTKRTAVIVEDDCTVVYLLKQILINKEIHSFPANTIKEGLNLIKEHHPAFIFIDNGLPDGCGFEVISEILNYDSEVQVIAMTARDTFNAKDIALCAGAAYFLEKPFTIDQVYKSLKDHPVEVA
jgi:two-component system, OmpR family, response regulator